MPVTTAAIIVAAGSSNRMGFDKLVANLAGKPVLQRTLEAFEACPAITEVILVSESGREGEMETLCGLWDNLKVKKFTAGGSARHLSVWNGIQETSESTDLIAVHDGGRPLITPEQIQRCIDEAAKSGAAACARPITETVKRADSNRVVTESVDRENLWTMETPQVFRRELLIRAYRHVIDNQLTVTDEVSAVEQLGNQRVTIVENDSPNPKITFPSDLEFATRLLSSESTSSEETGH